ncbi:AraC family transcriptional regulator [Streptomyces sp. HNM1019]|uniref:AraC family transcriptional regulator n=1 Tax=Streptomyces sp. HNM1019 TaxID=3424717 RepID=UPI003D777970
MFNTAEVPKAHRFDAFRERLIKLHAPMDIVSEHAEDYAAEMRFLQFGSACVWSASVRSVHMRRTPRLIRQNDPDLYHLTLMLRGSKWLVQAGREGVCHPYNMHVADTSRPFQVGVGLHCQGIKMVGVEIPKVLLPLPRHKTDTLVARGLPGGEGMGSLLSGFLLRLSHSSRSLRNSDAARLETVLLDLIAALFAHEIDTEDALPPETRRQVLAVGIRAFIGKQLHNPELTPATIAAAQHISVSYLHRIFQEEIPANGGPVTVMGWIREQRLEHARRDLTDPAQRTRTIHEIAHRWGFSHHTTFTRAFRARYHVPPAEYRSTGDPGGVNHSMVVSSPTVTSPTAWARPGPTSQP